MSEFLEVAAGPTATAAVDEDEAGAAATSLLLSLSTEAAGRASSNECSEICLERPPAGTQLPASAGWEREGCTAVVIITLQLESDPFGRFCWPRFR